MTNHNTRKRLNEPIRTRSKYLKLVLVLMVEVLIRYGTFSGEWAFVRLFIKGLWFGDRELHYKNNCWRDVDIHWKPASPLKLITNLLLVCTWRHSGHVGGQGQKHFSPLGTKLYFHVNFSSKRSIILTPNRAALSRGCKPRIETKRNKQQNKNNK